MQSLTGLTLLGDAAQGLAKPLTPEQLASSHPEWERSIRDLGPWTEVDGIFRCDSWTGPDIAICGECDSSLDVMRALHENDAIPEWGSVLAVSQTSGRGQLRRNWVSPAGNIYAAWRWPKLAPCWDALLPLLAGAIAAEVFEEANIPISIKWPNDLLHDNRKVGGILVEERGDLLTVGMGINLTSAPADYEIRESWSPRATYLFTMNSDISLLGLWSGLVNRAKIGYTVLLSGENPRPFLSTLERKLAWFGQRVRVHGSQGEYTATITGISDDGGLILNRNGHVDTLYAGSLSPL